VGRLNFCKLSYSPVPGDRKSGIPADTERPAPTKTMIRLILRSLIFVAMPLSDICPLRTDLRSVAGIVEG